jgi:hypothetical protein
MPQEPGFTPVGAQPTSGTPGFTPVAPPAAAPSTTSTTTPSLELTDREREAAGQLTGAAGAIQRFGSGAWSEAKGLVKGVGQAATTPPQTPIDKALSMMGNITGTNPLAVRRLLIDPAIEKGKSTVRALQSGEWIKGGLGAAATLNPFAPDVTKLYEQSAAGDVAGAMGRGSVDIAAMKGMDLVNDAVKLINRAPSIEQGKTGYVNGARRAVTLLDNKISERGVGARANQVIAADETHNAQTQSQGYVNGAAVSNAMQSTMQATGMGANVAPTMNAQMTMQQAKVMMTQLGRQAAGLDRAGKAPEAAVIWSAYDALREETMKRAKALDTLQPGAGHAQAWGDYAKEFKEHLKVIHSGPLGALMEGDPVKALDKLIDGEGMLKGRDVAGKRIVGADDWFKKYDEDFTPITEAVRQGKVLNELSDFTSNALMGKIKMIARHPVVGIPMILAETRALKGMGMGGGLGGFVLPLIIAAKVGKLLDHIQIHKILVDIGKQLPAEDMSLSGQPLGPHDAMTGPIGPSGGAPAGGPPAPDAGGGAGGVPTAPAPTPAAPFGTGAGGDIAHQLGLMEREPSAPGLVSFQDSQTGGSIEMREGFTDQQLADKVAAHRAAMKASPPGSDIAAEKAARAKDTYEQDLAARLKGARKSKGKD